MYDRRRDASIRRARARRRMATRRRARGARAAKRALACALALVACVTVGARWRSGGEASSTASTSSATTSVDDDAREGAEAATAARDDATRSTLKATLLAGAKDEGACTNERDVRGRFATRDFALVREVERRTRARVGFGWARWGDAEMISSARDGSPMRLAVRALMSVSATPNCVLNVGVHWLCNGALRNNWNAAMDGVDVNDTIGHAFFFLPMGDPGDDDRSMWKENGVDGYINVVREAKRKVILVGPPHVEGLPFIGHSAFVDASGKGMGGDGAADSVVQRIFEIGDAFDEPPVVIMAAGMAAKTAILSAQDRINSKGWGLIDAGTTLDGYAGVKSRDYNDPRVYCRKSRERARDEHDGVDFWFAKGVCEKFGA